MAEWKPFCWHCGKALAKNPRGGYFATPFESETGTVAVHKCCLSDAEKAITNPHIWPSTEVRSDTYR